MLNFGGGFASFNETEILLATIRCDPFRYEQNLTITFYLVKYANNDLYKSIICAPTHYLQPIDS